MRTILCSALLLISFFLFGQPSYKKGYIINNSGDSIQGYVKEDVEEKLAHAINFKDQAGSIKILSIGDIKEFGFEGEGSFRQVNYVDPLDSLKSKTHFAKFLMEGSYRLFSFRRKDDLNFIVFNKDTSYLLYDDEKSEFGDVFEKGNYQSMLSFFSRECPKVNATASTINFSEESLLKFFVSLEKCSGNPKTAIVYYSKSKAQKNILLSAGGMQWDKQTEMAIQALGQFVLPSVNMKSSLLAGIVYWRNTDQSIHKYTFVEDHNKYETQVFEIPILFRYEILQKIIQPYVYGGAGVAIKKEKTTSTRISLITADTEATGTTETSTFGATVLFGVGINVRVAKDFFLNADWRYDLDAHLPVLGLAYKIRLSK
jgi:hypothetical protein